MSNVFAVPALALGAAALRPFAARDADDTATACSDAETQRWLPLPSPYTRQVAEHWCTSLSESLRQQGDGLNLAVVVADTDRLVGCVSLKRTDWRALCTEISYWTVPQYRRRGLTSQAVRLLTDWALSEYMERVELRAAPSNMASCRVAMSAGFTQEGVLRNAGFTHAGRTDLLVFSRVRDDLRR